MAVQFQFTVPPVSELPCKFISELKNALDNGTYRVSEVVNEAQIAADARQKSMPFFLISFFSLTMSIFIIYSSYKVIALGAVAGNEGRIAARNMKDNKNVTQNITLLFISISAIIAISVVGNFVTTYISDVFHGAELQGFADGHMKPEFVEQVKEMDGAEKVLPLYVLHSMTYFILLLATVGVINNLLINYIQKRRTIAMYKSIGLSNRQNRKMTLIEGFSSGLIGQTRAYPPRIVRGATATCRNRPRTNWKSRNPVCRRTYGKP